MAKLGGPKGPSDPPPGARILPLRSGPRNPVEAPAPTPASQQAEQPDPGDVPPGDESIAQGERRKAEVGKDSIGSASGGRTAPQVAQRRVRLELPSTRDPGMLPDHSRGTGVSARLAALGVKGSESLPIKTAARDAVRFKDTPIGKIVEGSLTIESARALHQKLAGVVKVAGDFGLHESDAKSADLLIASSLREVDGRVTIEGNRGVETLILDGLERARSIYIGYHDNLRKVVLPSLRELETALIFEGNPALVEIQLPVFQRAGLYVHVHDHASLTIFAAPALGSLDELSVVDCPRLRDVIVGSREQPARVARLELKRNGAVSFPHLFVRSR